MSSDIKKNYVYNVIYRLSICILPLIITPYTARVLGVEGNGLYSFSSTVACYFIMFGKLGLDNYGNRSIAFCRDDVVQRSKTFWSIYVVQIGTAILAMLLYICVVFAFFRDNILIYRMQFIYVLSVLFDITWFFYGMEKFRITTIRSLVSRLLLIAGVFLFVSTERDLWIFTCIMSVSFLLEQVMLFPFVFKYVRFVKLTGKDILCHIKPNLKLFVPLLALSIYNWMDKLMLGLMYNTDSVAYYSYAESIINLPKGIVVALGTVMLPRLSQLAVKNNVEASRKILRNSMSFICFISCALCFGIAGVSPVFVPWFFSPAYNQTILLTIELAIVMIPMSISDVVQTQYLMPFKKDNIYIKSVSMGAVVNLLMNFALIPPLKASGSVIATLGAELTVCIYQLVRIREVYSFRHLFNALFPFLICGFLEFGVTYSMCSINIHPIILILLQVAAGGCVYLLCCVLYFIAFRGAHFGDIIRGKIWK